jgi:hypothetical protein
MTTKMAKEKLMIFFAFLSLLLVAGLASAQTAEFFVSPSDVIAI